MTEESELALVKCEPIEGDISNNPSTVAIDMVKQETEHVDLKIIKEEFTEDAFEIVYEQADSMLNFVTGPMKCGEFEEEKCEIAIDEHFSVKKEEEVIDDDNGLKLEDSRVGAGRKPYKCTHCYYRTRSESELQKHAATHPARESRFECLMCGYKCVLQQAFKLHLLTHNEQTFKCDICGRQCNSKYNLQHHMWSHAYKKPFKCDQCGLRTFRWCNYEQHVRAHVGEKPFLCDKCGFRCIRKRHLEIHRATHDQDEKPFRCGHCSYRSASESQLRSHVSVHTNRLLKCDVCSYMCVQQETFDTHVQIHNTTSQLSKCNDNDGTRVESETKPFKCGICDEKFGSKPVLINHVVMHKK